MGSTDRKRFPTTSWTVVWSAGGTEREGASEALARLCEAYWFPLYHYARRLGSSDQEAQDLVQGFFASLLERRRLLKGVSGTRSQFRTYLKAAFRNFLSDERDRAHAAKRKGREVPLEIDLPGGERRFLVEPIAKLTPDRAYDKLWALAVLDRALARLKASYEERGAGTDYALLLPCLEGGPPDRPGEDVARALGVSVNAARVAASRFRDRYEECVVNEIRDTVSDPKMVKGELEYLRKALSAPDP